MRPAQAAAENTSLVLGAQSLVDSPRARPAALPMPDFAELHQQRQIHPHLTQQLLWEEYRQANPDGYRYTRFCELFKRWRPRKTWCCVRNPRRPFLSVSVRVTLRLMEADLSSAVDQTFVLAQEISQQSNSEKRAADAEQPSADVGACSQNCDEDKRLL